MRHYPEPDQGVVFWHKNTVMPKARTLCGRRIYLYDVIGYSTAKEEEKLCSQCKKRNDQEVKAYREGRRK